MSRFWPFRSAGNFTLSLLGVCGVSFYGYGMYKQTFFSNPVVSQTIKIVGKNQKIKQMIGYPLSYQSSNNNRFNQAGNQVYYSFKVMGPRGSTQVEVTASHLKARDIYEYDQQNQSYNNAKNNLLKLQKEQTELKQNLNQLKKSSGSWRGGSKNQEKIKKLQQQIQSKSKQLYEVKRLISDMISQRNNRKNLYYIPQKQYYSQIVNQNGKDNQNTLPQNATLYKLENVACQLPNKSRINILNSGKVVKNQDDQTNIQISANMEELKKPVYAKLHQKLAINVAQLSDQQMEQYSKHKTNFMYQKHGMYRFISFFMFVVGSAAFFIYLSKNKTINMSHSVLFYLLQKRLAKDLKMQQFIKSKKLGGLELDKNVGGGMKNNVFKCQVGVKNVTMGKVQFQGKKTKSGDYQYQKLVFKYVQNNKHRQIDLLK